MSTHCVIKYDHDDGVKLKRPVLWCGSEKYDPWLFQDAQHAALSLERGQLVFPCEQCRNAIIKALKGE